MFKSTINHLLILHFISIVMVFESIFMLLPILISLYYKETITTQLVYAFTATLFSGFILNVLTRKKRKVEPSRNESILIVSIGWLILGLIGTLPYLFTRSIPGFTNAFFESISGFTTTGSSILQDIEALPKSILFWRAETHWIGGMGIIVLVVAIMPFLKINGIYLFHSETSNVADEKITTRIRQSARNLWLVYIGLTFVEIILLCLGKMPLFDSVCHSFATIATGGFSTKNDSIAGYSAYIQYVIALFMLLSGINFTLHIYLLKRRIKPVLKNEELKLYLSIIIVVGILIATLVYLNTEIGLEKAIRDSFFQVISIITATGFATADYLNWPIQSIILIAMLMLIGASAGSTGGGVKVIRHLISLKKIKHSIKSIISPNSYSVIKYNDKILDIDYISRVMAFIAMYYTILIISTLAMMLTGQDAATSFGAVATSMAGIGPGFGTVGPASNFYYLPVFSKYFLAFLMILGRLEIYSVLILFTRSFWRS